MIIRKKFYTPKFRVLQHRRAIWGMMTPGRAWRFHTLTPGIMVKLLHYLLDPKRRQCHEWWRRQPSARFHPLPSHSCFDDFWFPLCMMAHVFYALRSKMKQPTRSREWGCSSTTRRPRESVARKGKVLTSRGHMTERAIARQRERLTGRYVGPRAQWRFPSRAQREWKWAARAEVVSWARRLTVGPVAQFFF
jgi:hypothetical protein